MKDHATIRKVNNNAPGLRQRLVPSFAAATLLVLNIALFTPFIIYHFNRVEFTVSFPAILINAYLLWIVVGIVVLSVIGIVLRGRKQTRFIAFIFALGVLTWLQSTFILWDLGKLTGIKIVWEDFFIQGVIDGTIWVAVIVLALVFYTRVAKVAVVVSFVLIFGQLGHMVFSSVTVPKEQIDKSRITKLVAGKSFYEFSKEKNVIVVVFDAFQSNIFAEIIALEPRFSSELDGFVFFKDTTSLFPRTKFSVPSFFSSKVYQLDRPLEDFLNTSMNAETISTAFLEEGYVVDIAPINIKYCGPHTNCFLAPVPYGGTPDEIKRAAAAYLMDLSIFRAVPVFLKNFLVYRDQKWQFQRMAIHRTVGDKHLDSLKFLGDITKGARGKEMGPTFKYLHLLATHLPYVMTEDCRLAGKVLPGTKANAINVSRCSVEGFTAFMKKLKSIGVYDNSLIVLMSDHGSYLPVDSLYGENPELLKTHRNIESVVSLAMPLLVIKPPHESGPLKVSSAQVTLSDLPATLTSMMGIKKVIGGGRPVFSIDPKETRSRKFYNYRVCRNCTEDGYFIPFEEFDIKGSLFDIASWKYAGLKHATNDTTRPPTSVQFKPGGELNYLLRNWYKKNLKHEGLGEWGRWAHGDAATMLLDVPSDSDAELKVRLYAPKYVQPQRVTVRVDGLTIGSWDTPYIGEQFADYTLRIKKDPNRKSESLIEFVFEVDPADDPETKKYKQRVIFFGSVYVSPISR